MRIESDLFKNMSDEELKSIRQQIINGDAIIEEYAKVIRIKIAEADLELDFQDIVSITKILFIDEFLSRHMSKED